VACARTFSVTLPIISRATRQNIDRETGRRIEQKVRSGTAPKPAEGMGER
jgi:catalase